MSCNDRASQLTEGWPRRLDNLRCGKCVQETDTGGLQWCGQPASVLPSVAAFGWPFVWRSGLIAQWLKPSALCHWN
jgi:hypothetical protein